MKNLLISYLPFKIQLKIYDQFIHYINFVKLYGMASDRHFHRRSRRHRRCRCVPKIIAKNNTYYVAQI